MINYKKILWKYLNHVGCEEGITFIPRNTNYEHKGYKFTEEELIALQELENMKDSPE